MYEMGLRIGGVNGGLCLHVVTVVPQIYGLSILILLLCLLELTSVIRAWL